jgi:uroporphyrin-III C-methyltransferase
MKVWFIGAGPGDPELMTRKAWQQLSQADVVLHDVLMDVAGMQEAAPHARWLEVGKRSGRPSVEQAFICRTLVALAKQGLTVVRLKGGDPAIFGRLAEELQACRAKNIEVEIIPGVTAACAAAADLQTSLTLRGESRSVAFVTPRLGKHETGKPSEWLTAAISAQTVALYMASAQAKDICHALIMAGKPKRTPICIVENASRAGQRFKSTLFAVAQDGLPTFEGPVTLLVGQALSLAQAEPLPLTNISAEPAIAPPSQHAVA